MADEKPGDAPEPAEIDIEAVDDLPPEEASKLLRGEIEPPKKGALAKEPAIAKDEFDVDPKSETVPHGQFHRVNERRKQAEERAKSLEGETAKERARADLLTQRFTELLEAGKSAQEPVKEAEPDLGPDPDEDPIGALRWAREQRAKDFEARKQWDQEQAQRGQVERVVNSQAERFRAVQAEHPVLTEAYQSLLNSWGNELAFQGFKGNDLTARVNQLEAQWATWAAQNRQPIEDVIWNLAQSRGYRAKDAPADPTPGADATGSDADGKPRDANGKFVAAAAQMDKREATKAAAKSLGGSGGPGDVTELTPQMIADMPDAEWKAFKAKYGDNAMRKAFGVQ